MTNISWNILGWFNAIVGCLNILFFFLLTDAGGIEYVNLIVGVINVFGAVLAFKVDDA